MSLKGEVALVTGASRGIGRAIANILAEQGAAVVGTATTEAGAERISEHFSELGLNVQGQLLNVTEAESIKGLMAAMKEGVGSPSILVNNAGITRDNLIARMKDDEWDDIISTNLTSVFRLSKAVLRPMMKAKKGRIINIASVVGLMGNAGQANYAAAKAGIIGFSKSMAREVGSRGITVNVVAPGFIETDMTGSLPQAQVDSMLSSIPLSRLGSVDEIAAGVAYLASPLAAYVTGETLNINGGMNMA